AARWQAATWTTPVRPLASSPGPGGHAAGPPRSAGPARGRASHVPAGSVVAGCRSARQLLVAAFFAAGAFLVAAVFAAGAFFAAVAFAAAVVAVLVPVLRVAVLAGAFAGAFSAAALVVLAARVPAVVPAGRAAVLVAVAVAETRAAARPAVALATVAAVAATLGSLRAPLTTSLKPCPARNAGTDVFFTRTFSPVAGLRAIRAARSRFSNTPNPVTATFSPFDTARR